jgi:hypothetical protein
MLTPYIDHSLLPAPPPSVDYTAKAMAALSQIYGNDHLGDCVIAGGAHFRGVTTGNASGSPIIFSMPEIVAQYSAIGGYVDGDESTDQGCDEITAMDFWKSTGFADGVKLAGAVGVDAYSQVEVMQSIYLFENVLFGMELPQAWADDTSAPVWDVAGDAVPQNGHCVLGVGYTSDGVIISTWGMLKTITWAAVVKYAVPVAGGELHAMLSPDMIASGQTNATNGFNWTQLQTDLGYVGPSQ